MLITTSNLLDVPARILMALIFMIAGLGKLGAPADTIAYMRSFGVPGVLLYPTIAFEIGGGLLPDIPQMIPKLGPDASRTGPVLEP